MTNFFDYLKERGFVYQMTNEDKIRALLSGDKKITFYLGIDPTADSLHIGHFFGLLMFRHLQRQGHHGILLIGGATAMVGDPTGKSDMRKMMSAETVAHNVAEIKQLASRFIQMDGDNPALILDNSDWINKYTYVQFMRKVGVHFNVSKMLASESYAKRLENGGLTFLEMGYMLMQAYDFVYLNRTYGCSLEIGGSDQWGNIVAGTELSRKMNVHDEGKESTDRPDTFGLTCPLLMTKDGKKMGKTEKGTLWVARDRTTPFDFYQYFYNVEDDSVSLLLKAFTEIPTAEIEALCQSDILAAKRKMAYEITRLVHGTEAADKATEAAKALFAGGHNLADVPTADFDLATLQKGISIVDFVVQVGFFDSKGSARRMIEQGGLTCNGEKVADVMKTLTPADIKDGAVLLQRGKKNFLRVLIK